MMYSFRRKLWALFLFPVHVLMAQESFVLPTQDIDRALERAEWVTQVASFQAIGFFHFQKHWPAENKLPTSMFTLPNGKGSFDMLWGAWASNGFLPEYRLTSSDTGLVSDSLQVKEAEKPLLRFGSITDSLLSHDSRFKGEDLHRFVRELPQGQIEVFCLPPFNPSASPVYGKYVHLIFDKTSGEVLSESFLNAPLQTIPPQPTEALVLTSESRSLPSAAAYAFAWMHRRSFADIKLETAVMVSVLTRKKTGEWVWMHARKKSVAPASPSK